MPWRASPETDAEQFKKDLLARPGYIRRGPVDVDILERIGREITASLENFLDKVSAREIQIRAPAASE